MMDSNFISRYKWFVFMAITILQVIVIAFWGTQKANLYWDEFYTLERAHYISDSTPHEHYIDDDSEYGFEKWLPISMVQETLFVSSDESVLRDSAISVIKKLFGDHSYSVLLNLVSTVLSPGVFSLWPSIVLNTIFFVLNQFVLFALSSKITSNSFFSLAVITMYGFGSMCLSMTIFVRFYMMVTFFVTLFTYAHIQYWNTEDAEHIKQVFWLIVAGVSLFFSYKNAQFSVLYGGLLILTFTVLLWIRKGVKRFFLYTIPIYGGGLFFLTKQTDYLDMLFDFKDAYEKSEGAVAWTLDSIAEFRFSLLPDRMLDIAHIMGKYLFGSYFVMLAFFCVVIVRYIIIRLLLGEEKDSHEFSVYIWVIFVSTMIFILFFTIFGLYEQVRYISFVFPELVIIVMAIIFYAFKKTSIMYVLPPVLIILMVLSVSSRAKVDFLYSKDRDDIERIREYDINSWILYANGHTTFITYEAAFVADGSTEFYVYSRDIDNSVEHLANQLREEMLIVGYFGVDQTDVFDMLIDKGYVIEPIGETYQYSFNKATLTRD